MSPASPAARPTILLVDDDESALQTYGAFLRLEGYNVLTAGTAAGGLELAASRRPDAVLLDLKLPEVEDGLGVLRTLRARGDRVPVSVLTGEYALPKDVEEAIRGLGAGIAFKPLWFEDCLALIRKMLGAEP
jgi:DNA-binding response OmpR family regulator